MLICVFNLHTDTQIMASSSSQPRQQSMIAFVTRGDGGGGPPGGGGGGEPALGEEAAAGQPAYAKGPQGKFVQTVVEKINKREID